MKRTAVIPAALERIHSLHIKEEKIIMHWSDATFNYAPNPAFFIEYVTCTTLHTLVPVS